MVKHTQTKNSLSVFGHFVRLALKGLKIQPTIKEYEEKGHFFLENQK